MKKIMKTKLALNMRARGNEYSPNNFLGRRGKFIFLKSYTSNNSKPNKAMEIKNAANDRYNPASRIANNPWSIPQLWIDTLVLPNIQTSKGCKVQSIRRSMMRTQKRTLQKVGVEWMFFMVPPLALLLAPYYKRICRFVNFVKGNCRPQWPGVVAEGLRIPFTKVLWAKGLNATGTSSLPLQPPRGGR
jgi:hypothetical protein